MVQRMDEGINITYGDKAKVARDYDGYVAVRIQNTAFVEDPRWITASGYDYDLEENVRNLARALMTMADRMAAERAKESA